MTELPTATRPAPAPGRVRRFLSGTDSGIRNLFRRRKSVEKLRRTVAILTLQQETLPDGILTVDARGKVLFQNRSLTSILRLDQWLAGEDALVESLRSLVSAPSDLEDAIEYARLASATHLPERTIPLRDGRFLALAIAPIRGRGSLEIGRTWYLRDITDQRESENLRSALFRISEITHASRNLDELYASIHGIVGELMDATNFYIAIHDTKRRRLFFPYFVDQRDPRPEGSDPDEGLTGWVLRKKTTLLANPDTFAKLVEAGEVEDIGSPSVDWLGVPLLTPNGDAIGVLGVQSYEPAIRYGEREKQILQFVSQHVASAIEHQMHADRIRESEILHRQMFENNRAIKLVIDPADGSIVDANPAACEFYGYDEHEILQKKIFEINTKNAEQIRSSMELATSSPGEYFLFQHRLASGEIRDVEVYTGPLDFKGRHLLYSIVHDVTERRRATEALSRSEEHFRSLIENATDVIALVDPRGKIRYVSPSIERILSVPAAEIMNSTIYSLADPADDATIRSTMQDALTRAGATDPVEIRFQTSSGDFRTLEAVGHRIFDEGETTIVFQCRDVTERKRIDQMMRFQTAAMEAAMDGISIIDRDDHFTYVNPAFFKLYGYRTSSSLLGKNWRVVIDGADHTHLETQVRKLLRQNHHWRGQVNGVRRDGRVFPQELSLTLMENGSAICVARDITDRMTAEEQIKHLAYHDALTSLPNRLLFKDRLGVALSRAQRDKTRVAVAFFDLDGFKDINDSHGHNAGDQVLQVIADRIQSCVRDSDTVARFGGDEFTLLLPALHDTNDASRIVQKVLEAIRKPLELDGNKHYLTSSAGISIYPFDGEHADSLIKNADMAMYQAKETGRDRIQLFNPAINERSLQRLQLETGLRRAIENREFVVHYQPILQLLNGRIHGMEALVRWRQPDGTVVPPAEFIPLAESTGLMIPIGALVLDEALGQLAALERNGFRGLVLSVNIAVCQLQHGSLPDTIRQSLERHRIAPSQLLLEITESTAMQNPDASIATLDALKALGVRIALDDFGMGHSSLSYLKRFPIDTLKIDRSFINDLSVDDDTASIVTAIIAMGHKLRLSVVAEGVEFESQRTFLRENQCDQMQGYLYHRPVEAAQFEEILREHNASAHQWQIIRG